MAGPTKLDLYQYALRHLADARLDLITDDVEARYALDDAWDRAVNFVLRQAPWRFALVTATLAAGGGPTPAGYTFGYAFPADWLRTHAIYLVTAGREVPIDLRDNGTVIAVNVGTAPTIRYVSANYSDPEGAGIVWPEHFAQAVGAYLAFLVAERITGDRGAPGMMSKLYSQLVDEAQRLDGVAEDPWLPHQRSGAFLRVARTMIDEGFWRFAMVTAHVTAAAGAGDGGLAHAYTVPADWSRTRSLYRLASDGRRCPFDVREVGGAWHTDETDFYAQYVSPSLAMDSTKWPDHYMRAVLRQLEYDTANRRDSTEGPPTYGRDYQQRADVAWKEALADTVDSEADPPDPWLGYQLDGSFIRAARAVIARGYWWWALKETDLSAQESLSPSAGFPYRFALPSDWLRTHALFVGYDGAECPINIRESAEDWSTDASFFTARYVSTAALDATTWPDIVGQAVLAYLDWKSAPPPAPVNGQPAPAPAGGAVFAALLQSALDLYSRPEDPWLRFQLDGRYIQAVKLVLEKARWRFAIKTVLLETDNDPNNASITLGGTASAGDTITLTVTHSAITGGAATVSYTLTGEDTLDTAALRLAALISANSAIEAAGISAAASGAEIDTVLSRSLSAIPDAGLTASPSVAWTYSLSGGATETVTVGTVAGTPASQGYTYRFPKPLDWLRTIRLWFSLADGTRPIWYDIDFRDEGGALHANYAPLALRYLSRIGLDATQWPSNFRDGVLAWLEHSEARSDPKMAAVAKARLEFFQLQCREAETLDDEREIPQTRTSGRFVAGRYGRGTRDLENALPPFTPL